MLYWLLYELHDRVGSAERLSLHHVPGSTRDPHGGRRRNRPRTAAHPPPARAPDRSGDPGGGTRIAPRQGRHPDHGRAADPGSHRRPDPAVGRPHRAVGVGGDAHDAALRRHRPPRRLPQGAARQATSGCAPGRSSDCSWPRRFWRRPRSASWPDTPPTPGSWWRRSSRTSTWTSGSSTSRSSPWCWSDPPTP